MSDAAATPEAESRQAREAAARDALIRIVQRHGPGLAERPERAVALLRDAIPELRREIGLLGAAAREGGARRLRDAMAGDAATLTLALPQITADLAALTAVEVPAARWALESWAVALGAMPAAAPPQPPLAGAAPSRPAADSALWDGAGAPQPPAAGPATPATDSVVWDGTATPQPSPPPRRRRWLRRLLLLLLLPPLLLLIVAGLEYRDRIRDRPSGATAPTIGLDGRWYLEWVDTGGVVHRADLFMRDVSGTMLVNYSDPAERGPTSVEQRMTIWRSTGNIHIINGSDLRVVQSPPGTRVSYRPDRIIIRPLGLYGSDGVVFERICDQERPTCLPFRVARPGS